MDEIELKLKLKEILKMERIPKNLDIIHYFLWTIRRDLERTDQYLKEIYIDDSLEPLEILMLLSIDELRRMLDNSTYNEETEDNYSYISTKVLKEKFGMKSKDYNKYFNMFIKEFKDDGFYSYTKKETRRIKSWKTEALTFYEQTLKYNIPQSFYKKVGG